MIAMLVIALVLFVPLGLLGMLLTNINPYLSNVVNQAISSLVGGPLLGGYLWLLLRLARGEPAGVGDAFAGFTRQPGQLILSALVQGMAALLCLAPLLVIQAEVQSSMGRGGPPNLSPGLLLGMGGLGFVGLMAMTYLMTLWTHSYFLIIDKGCKFWPSLELSRRLVQKRWWMTFLLNLVGLLIAIAGVFACLIGLLVTIPLYFLMRVWLYEDNFRDLEPQPSAH